MNGTTGNAITIGANEVWFTPHFLDCNNSILIMCGARYVGNIHDWTGCAKGYDSVRYDLIETKPFNVCGIGSVISDENHFATLDEAKAWCVEQIQKREQEAA